MEPLGSRFDTDEPNANKEKENQEIDVKKCGIPNQMGLNKQGLEFLSSAHSKAGKHVTFAMYQTTNKKIKQLINDSKNLFIKIPCVV